jgi:DeoR/GlpR family transcriptional regulator of sugar metabolism
MLIAERRQSILNLLTKEGFISITELGKRFDVSEMTIRRDLAYLQEQGLLKRTYGGAVPTEPAFFELSQQVKLSAFVSEKERIASYCAEIITDGDVIILDSGSTTMQIAKKLKDRNLTVITNDLFIISELANYPTIQLLVVGGEVRRATNNMTGLKAIEFFNDLHANKLFLGVEGVEEQSGLSVPDLAELSIKRRMMRSARQVIVVADHSKIGRNTMGVIAPLNEADLLITDHGVNKEVMETIESKIKTIRV